MHGVPKGGKITRYQSCVQVKKSGIEPVEFAMAPELPEECCYLWECFTRLSSANLMEIESYTRLTGIDFDPWEVESIILLNKIRSSPPEHYQWSQK